MNRLAENIATPGELAQLSSDMKCILYVFLFAIVLTVTMSIIGYLKGLGK